MSIFSKLCIAIDAQKVDNHGGIKMEGDLKYE
jgi:hypothetical protein